MSDQPVDPKRDNMRLDLDAVSLSPPGAEARVAGRAEGDTRFADPAQQPSGRSAPAGYGGYGAGYDQAVSGDDVHLVDYLRVVHKRRWTAITAFLIVFGWVTVYTFTVTPIFSARVQILIENEDQNVVKFQEVYDQNKTTNDYYQTQYRILQSRLLARRTLDAEKLWEHPLFAGKPLGGGDKPSGLSDPSLLQKEHTATNVACQPFRNGPNSASTSAGTSSCRLWPPGSPLPVTLTPRSFQIDSTS